MLTSVTDLVAQIHDSGTQLVLAVNGGSEAVSSLLTVPGASRSVLLATAPYSSAALVEWLGSQPEAFCSSRTARGMAMAAYEKARQLTASRASLASPVASNVAGIACTVSLASDRPKRGPHRFFVATQTAVATTCLHLELVKGRRTRAEEEHVAGLTILNEIAAVCGVHDTVPLTLTQSELLQRAEKTAPADWQTLLAGSRKRIGTNPAIDRPFVLFPGAFNPLHSGHRHMAEKASQMLGTPVEFEISITNVDKPPLDFLEIDERLQQFAPDQNVWLTRAATFAEKAALFPGVTFVVGVDTLQRIALPRYYESMPAMVRAIDEIAAAGCRFLVFGRKLNDVFQHVDEVNIPASLRALCQGVSEVEFREDISSTELRGPRAAS